MIGNYRPFGQKPIKLGGREWRAVRTERYTYVRDRQGPWLLFDNRADPYQMNNLVNLPEHVSVQKELDQALEQKLAETDNRFE